MLAWSRAYVGPLWAMSASCWAILVYFVACVGLCWARVGTTILGLSGPRLGMRVECCVCQVFFWCCGGIWMVLLVVYGWSLAGGAWHVVSSQNMDRYFNGVLHLHAQTQYTSIHTIKQSCTCGPWHLQRFSCPDRRSLDKKKAACVACDKVNKCKSHPKIMKDSQNDFAFSRESVIFPARFLFDWMVEDFMRILPHLLAAGKPKCKLHLQYIEGCNYRACSACSISSLSFVVLALLYWFNADIWVMCGHVLLVSFGSGFLHPSLVWETHWKVFV